jgi:deazaflavin-dependent oxidoreductase (nitroreductase family)
MAKRVKTITPPTGLARIFFRLPITLYRAGLGWLMSSRFLLLNHTGRKSGLPRQVVLEVVHHDPQTHTYVVNAGFGEKSQWYQNLLHNPQASIQVGRRKLDVTAVPLSPEEGAQTFVDFCRRHPTEAKFTQWMGFEVDGTIEDYYDMGTQMLFVALKPR